ncbi:hypothetical protein F511_27231 [Dorcoceras hygrometricum]|uniref:Peptidase A3A domain-containing protein n=1 Tax=Dorcoceras hygrometricum TaxID=472368 RepID=A0A2Z7BDC7_9LAMI|nr:hypothetical protein F511_27231 [Dorcoceras hygrometricum]
MINATFKEGIDSPIDIVICDKWIGSLQDSVQGPYERNPRKRTKSTDSWTRVSGGTQALETTWERNGIHDGRSYLEDSMSTSPFSIYIPVRMLYEQYKAEYFAAYIGSGAGICTAKRGVVPKELEDDLTQIAHSRCRYSNLQDVCMAIESLTTLDLPMVVDSIGIYELKGPYYTLTMTDWFLQALSVIPRGSWGDVARRFTMFRWVDQENVFSDSQ